MEPYSAPWWATGLPVRHKHGEHWHFGSIDSNLPYGNDVD
jgi:hypothetical protein